MSKYRFCALLITMCLVICMFAGCSNEQTSVEITTDTQVETTETEDNVVENSYFPLSEKVYLTMYSTDPMQFASITDDVTTLTVYTEMEARTNVRVDFVYGTEEGWGLMLAADEYPDLLENVSSKYGGGMSAAIDEEFILDLTDVVADYMPYYSAVIASNDEYGKCSVLDDGRIGAIMGFWEENYPVTSGPVVRKDWVEELGMNVEDIVTYDDVHELLQLFKTNYGSSSPMWVNEYGVPVGNYFCAGYGVAGLTAIKQNRNAMYQVDGVVKYGPIEDGYYEYMKMFNQWYSEGLIYRDFVSSNSSIANPDMSLVTDGGVGFMHVGSNMLSIYDDVGIEFVAITDPVQEAGNTTHFNAYNSLTTGAGICISTDCKNVEIAAKWLDYRFSDDGYILWNFGVEGQAFEYDDEGDPYWTELITDNELGMSNAINMYARSAGVFLVNWEKNMYGYTENQLEAADIWTSTSDYAYVYPLGAALSADESDVFNAKYNDIATYVNEMSLKFMIGEIELTEESFENFREELRRLDIETLIQCYQKAYDRYIER